MIESEGFIEHNKYNENFYGTSKYELERLRKVNKVNNN
jgi:guanylate kinase